METLVRRAVDSDLDWILSQLKIFAPLYGTKRSLYGDESYAREGLRRTMESHLLLVAVRGETLMGFIAGIVSPHLYNPAIRILCELFWWVSEDFRLTPAAALLFSEFVRWGKENCDWITFGVTETTPIKETSLLRRGFQLQERSYLMEVKPCPQPSLS